MNINIISDQNKYNASIIFVLEDSKIAYKDK